MFILGRTKLLLQVFVFFYVKHSSDTTLNMDSEHMVVQYFARGCFNVNSVVYLPFHGPTAIDCVGETRAAAANMVIQ